jgi:putative transposase
MLLARLTDPELTRAVQFLKEENKVLRSKLGKKVQVTPPERRRMLKVAEPLGDAIKELITVVTYRTFLRWKSDAKKKVKKAKREKRKRGRPRTPEEIREIVLRIARETGWGYTRILGELKKLRIKLSRNTVKKHPEGERPRSLCIHPVEGRAEAQTLIPHRC